MENYETLVEAINGLREEGYVEDFNLKKNYLEYRSGEFKVLHDEFHVDKFYRFEGMTDPSDQVILYAISSGSHRIKGILVNGYGIYSEELADEMMNKLSVH